MTLIGSTMMGEQAGPKQLVRDVALAEKPAVSSARGTGAARPGADRREAVLGL